MLTKRRVWRRRWWCSPETIGVAPAAEGLEMVGGDFFKSSTLPKGDVYLMKVRVIRVRLWVAQWPFGTPRTDRVSTRDNVSMDREAPIEC